MKVYVIWWLVMAFWKKVLVCVWLFWRTTLYSAYRSGEVGPGCVQCATGRQWCFLPVFWLWSCICPKWRASWHHWFSLQSWLFKTYKSALSDMNLLLLCHICPYVTWQVTTNGSTDNKDVFEVIYKQFHHEIVCPPEDTDKFIFKVHICTYYSYSSLKNKCIVNTQIFISASARKIQYLLVSCQSN